MSDSSTSNRTEHNRNSSENATIMVGDQICVRHRNPDGSLGGWVSETAYVAATAYVGVDALVLGDAQVLDHAEVFGYAEISGRATIRCRVKVFGYAIVHDDAEVSGRAKIYGYAVIGGDEKISGTVQVWENNQATGRPKIRDHANTRGTARGKLFGRAKDIGFSRIPGAA